LQLPGHILELESSIVADGILDKGRKIGGSEQMVPTLHREAEDRTQVQCQSIDTTTFEGGIY